MRPRIIWPIPKGSFKRCDKHGSTVIYAGHTCPACDELQRQEGDKK